MVEGPGPTDLVFAPSNPNIIYDGCAGLGILNSTDGGSTFTQIANLRQFVDQNP
jgi:hypothetical protein